VEYVLDGRHRRVGRRLDGALTHGWLYDGSLRIVAELDGAGAVQSRFLYGERPNVPEAMVRDGRLYRILTDHLGSLRAVVDTSDGAVVQRMDHDAWGNVLDDSNPGFVPFGFAGGLYDAATGLVRFGARDYDPSVGRWTAKDPIGFRGGDSQLYNYVLGSPGIHTDPTGLRLLLAPTNDAELEARFAEGFAIATAPPCVCALACSAGISPAPWDVEDIIVVPTVSEARVGHADPWRGIIEIHRGFGPYQIASILAHEAGHFTFPYGSHLRPSRFSAAQYCGGSPDSSIVGCPW